MSVPKIFVSSTFVDLSAVRGEICKWLTGLFGAELIVMETFGSDAAPPEISSVRRVRECDLFVGIYAHRYGTINESSGKSITELELAPPLQTQHGYDIDVEIKFDYLFDGDGDFTGRMMLSQEFISLLAQIFITVVRNFGHRL